MSPNELPDTPAARVNWVISAPSQTEMRRRYDLWAESYDEDLFDFEDYHAPRATADMAVKYLSKTDRILDAGAGTGLAGLALHAAGFENIVATDYSAGMLAIAEKKGIYQELVEGDLGAETPFETDSFDGLISVGTSSQIPAASLKEFARLVRPGGRFLFTIWVEAYVRNGFADIQHELEAAGRLALIHQGDPFQGLPKTEPEIWYEVWVFEVPT